MRGGLDSLRKSALGKLAEKREDIFIIREVSISEMNRLIEHLDHKKTQKQYDSGPFNMTLNKILIGLNFYRFLASMAKL